MDVKTTTSSKEFFSILGNKYDIIKPEFKSDRKNWVKYGPDNDFADDLLALYNACGIHGSIIDTKIKMMTGNGVIQECDEGEESERTEDFINSPNNKENLTKVYAKLSFDYELYGLAYIEVRKSKYNNEIKQINHIDATKIRWKKSFGDVESYYFSKDWSVGNPKMIEIPIYDEESLEKRQILPIVRYAPSQDYYSIPDYFSGLKHMYIDTEIANYQFSNLKQGMTGSYFIGFPVGDKTNEERKAINDALVKNHAGTDNVGKAFIAFYDAEGNNKPEITLLNTSNAAKQFDQLNKTTLQQILIAHHITNENLVGISTPGKLGNNDVLESYETYYNTVVKYDQQTILDSLNIIFLQMGLNPIKIENAKPYSYKLSEAVLSQILTRNELRDLVGYEPLEGEEEIKKDFKKEEFAVRTITASNYSTKIPKAELTDVYMWKTESGDDVCPSCEERNGWTNTLSEWLNIGIPSCPTGTQFTMDDDDKTVVNANFTHSPYSTFCEDACRCKLTKIGSYI